MNMHRLRRWGACAALGLGLGLGLGTLVEPAVAAAALPSIHDIYTAASTGQVPLARQEIDQVLAAYPNSAKAHYVAARIAALQGRWPDAASELASAQRLDPGLGFERRDSLDAFRRQVGAHTGQAPTRPGGMPLGAIGIALAVIAVLVLFAVYRASRRPQVQVMGPAGWPAAGAQPGYPQYPAGPGYAAPPGAYAQPAGGLGSGMLGAVGTGLAMGAGVAAGEMLVDKLFDHGNAAQPPAQAGADPSWLPQAQAGTPLPDDQDFGINDPGSWSDDGGASGGDWS